MRLNRKMIAASVAVVIPCVAIGELAARGPFKGPGPHGPGFRGRGGGANDPTHQADMRVIHALLAQRHQIRRQVSDTPTGVKTLTESDNPQVARLIRTHVYAMHERAKTRRPIHLRDPLFAALFANLGSLQMKVKDTPKGVAVEQTSSTALGAKLVQAHARVVSLFIANGHSEVRRNHPVPN